MGLLDAIRPSPGPLLGALARPALLAALRPAAAWDMRQGLYQDVLGNVQADYLIGDPPYGERTHKGQDVQAKDGANRRALSYAHFTPKDVEEYLDFWCPRVRGWMAIMSCSDLSPLWCAGMEKRGRQRFPPVPCIIRGMTCRLSGDGPSSWAVYLNVSRPRSREWCDGTRPGAYVVGRGGKNHIGGKPLDLMLQIVEHYSKPGALIVDPTAGWATTGVAALALGARFVGGEVDAATYQTGRERLAGIDAAEITKMRERLAALKKAKGALIADEDSANVARS